MILFELDGLPKDKGNVKIIGMVDNGRRWGYKVQISLTYLPLVWHIDASVNQIRNGSDNGLSPIWYQDIILTNAGLLSIRPLRTNISEILINIQNISFKTLLIKISSAKYKMADVLSRRRWVNWAVVNPCIHLTTDTHGESVFFK